MLVLDSGLLKSDPTVAMERIHAHLGLEPFDYVANLGTTTADLGRIFDKWYPRSVLSVWLGLEQGNSCSSLSRPHPTTSTTPAPLPNLILHFVPLIFEPASRHGQAGRLMVVTIRCRPRSASTSPNSTSRSTRCYLVWWARPTNGNRLNRVAIAPKTVTATTTADVAVRKLAPSYTKRGQEDKIARGAGAIHIRAEQGPLPLRRGRARLMTVPCPRHRRLNATDDTNAPRPQKTKHKSKAPYVNAKAIIPSPSEARKEDSRAISGQNLRSARPL